MNARERFLAACRCQPVDRPPVWVMRQAGRHLPEYRALKEQYTFHELVQTPELALEVTMQPIRRYGMDAAILFSDILVIPEALGQDYHFRPTGGIEMEFKLETDEDVEKLQATGIPDRLNYVSEAIKLLRKELGDERALIGFGGAPWTLATYMIEGQSSKDYARSRQWYYTERERFDALLETISDALIAYFRMQIEAGVDAIQIFDSWGGVLPEHHFQAASLKWITKVVDAIKDEVPVIVFSKNMHEHLDALVGTGANILGMSWTTNLANIRDRLPANVGVQGNLDPVLMNTTPELVEQEATRVLEQMRGKNGFIFNLGHGIMPAARPENMTRLVETIKAWS